jgi:hypothetical protein
MGLLLALWASAAIGATAAGILAALAREEVGALALFATLFAIASYFLDAEVRAWFLALDARAVRAAAWASEALVAAGAVALARAQSPWDAAATLPFGVWLLFVVPLAAALHAALVGRALRARALSSPRAKAPGVRRAAT